MTLGGLNLSWSFTLKWTQQQWSGAITEVWKIQRGHNSGTHSSDSPFLLSAQNPLPFKLEYLLRICCWITKIAFDFLHFSYLSVLVLDCYLLALWSQGTNKRQSDQFSGYKPVLLDPCVWESWQFISPLKLTIKFFVHMGKINNI